MSRRDDMEILGYTILYLMNPDARLVPWANCINDLDQILRLKCEFLKIENRTDRYQAPSNVPERYIKSGPNEDLDGDLVGTYLDEAKEEDCKDESKSSHIPAEFRMIHMFIREAAMIKYFQKPNYARF